MLENNLQQRQASQQALAHRLVMVLERKLAVEDDKRQLTEMGVANVAGANFHFLCFSLSLC